VNDSEVLFVCDYVILVAEPLATRSLIFLTLPQNPVLASKFLQLHVDLLGCSNRVCFASMDFFFSNYSRIFNLCVIHLGEPPNTSGE